MPYGGLLGYLANVCVLPPLVTCTLLVFKDPLLGIGRASADGTAAGILTTNEHRVPCRAPSTTMS